MTEDELHFQNQDPRRELFHGRATVEQPHLVLCRCNQSKVILRGVPQKIGNVFVLIGVMVGERSCLLDPGTRLFKRPEEFGWIANACKSK